MSKNIDFLAGLNGAAYKWNYSFLNGVTESQTSWGAPPMQKSSCRIPQFSAGVPYKKAIAIAMYGHKPFSL